MNEEGPGERILPLATNQRGGKQKTIMKIFATLVAWCVVLTATTFELASANDTGAWIELSMFRISSDGRYLYRKNQAPSNSMRACLTKWYDGDGGRHDWWVYVAPCEVGNTFQLWEYEFGDGRYGNLENDPTHNPYRCLSDEDYFDSYDQWARLSECDNSK